MKTSDFEYLLPPGHIAQTAAEPRDDSRLMVVHRSGNRGSLHCRFYDLPDFLNAGDILVCNDSRVIPARLKGSKVNGGGGVELLLLRRLEPDVWEVLAKPGRRLKKGAKVLFGSEGAIQAEVVDWSEAGTAAFKFSDERLLESAGVVPLPPYIRAPLADAGRYQTVYAREKGSVAAPTAGLHFTPQLMDCLLDRGVRFVFVTLHLSIDSFRPVKEHDPREHKMHTEYGEIGPEAAREIALAKENGKRIVCVGTSSVRILEHVARSNDGRLKPFSGAVDLFILPGHQFQVVDALITNFHLPRSTLLMLVSAFAGRDLILASYHEAIERGYRFYSFGDAMLLL